MKKTTQQPELSERERRAKYFQDNFGFTETTVMLNPFFELADELDKRGDSYRENPEGTFAKSFGARCAIVVRNFKDWVNRSHTHTAIDIMRAEFSDIDEWAEWWINQSREKEEA